MTSKNKKSFDTFLELSVNQKEAGLVIAKNQKERDDLIKTLSKNGFKKSVSVDELMENQKKYVVAGEKIDKKIYDFISQYSTGHVNIFNKNKTKSIMYSPDYEGRAVIIVVLKNNVKKLQKSNSDLLALTGLAYQS